MIQPPLIQHVEWRLVLKAAALAALAVLAANLIGGGFIQLLSLLAGFGATGYLATHRARNRPLVQGIVAVAMALGAIYVGVAVTERNVRTVAKVILVLMPFAAAPGAVGILAGHADRQLRRRPTSDSPGD